MDEDTRTGNESARDEEVLAPPDCTSSGADAGISAEAYAPEPGSTAPGASGATGPEAHDVPETAEAVQAGETPGAAAPPTAEANSATATEPKTATAPALESWRTSFGFSLLGWLLAPLCGGLFVLVAYVALCLYTCPAFDSFARLEAACILAVISAGLTLVYAFAFYRRYFKENPPITSRKAISFLNLFFGGIVFGCLWNHHLTKSRTTGTRKPGKAYGWAIAFSAAACIFGLWNVVAYEIPETQYAHEELGDGGWGGLDTKRFAAAFLPVYVDSTLSGLTCLRPVTSAPYLYSCANMLSQGIDPSTISDDGAQRLPSKRLTNPEPEDELGEQPKEIAEPRSPRPAPDPERFADADYGYAFDVPSGWEATDLRGSGYDDSMRAVLDANDQDYTEVFVFAYPSNSDQNTEGFSVEEAEDMLWGYPEGAEDTQVKKAEFGGKTYIEKTGEMADGYSNRRLHFDLCIHWDAAPGSKCFFLYSTYDDSLDTAYHEDFERLLDSAEYK